MKPLGFHASLAAEMPTERPPWNALTNALNALTGRQPRVEETDSGFPLVLQLPVVKQINVNMESGFPPIPGSIFTVYI